jgi:hypothetical protein
MLQLVVELYFMMHITKFKMLKWWRITVFGVLFTMFILVWLFFIGFSSNQSGKFFNKGHNAIWIGHEWVGEKKTDAEVQKLVNTLKKYQFDTVFVHVGPLNSDGGVEPKTYEYSIDFIDQVRKFDKSIEYQAWLGQIRSKIDLDNEDVRKNIKDLSIILTRMIGFDGIHFDIEPVWDEDLGFIEVLKEVSVALPDDKKISVALAEFIPESFIWFTENIHEFKNYNSEVNYENVAKYADQIVVMVYDTGIDNDWLYRWIVSEQTIRVTNLLDDKEVFIAIPAYEDLKDGFNPEVENVENGLTGIIKGLNNFRSEEDNFSGVAIYPFWEISEEEWGIYEKFWLK